MSDLKLVAVFVENKPGQTARVTRTLAEAGINICWVTIASNGSFGVMKFLVDQRDQAMRCLAKEGLMASLVDVLAVEVNHKPWSLQTIADALGRHEINLDNCSGFVANNRAVVLVETHDLAKAGKVMRQEGFRLLTREQCLRL